MSRAPVSFTLDGNQPAEIDSSVGSPEFIYSVGANAQLSATMDMGLEAEFLRIASGQIGAEANAGMGISYSSGSGSRTVQPAAGLLDHGGGCGSVPDFSVLFVQPLWQRSQIPDVFGDLPSLGVRHTIPSRHSVTLRVGEHTRRHAPPSRRGSPGVPRPMRPSATAWSAPPPSHEPHVLSEKEDGSKFDDRSPVLL